MRPDAAVTRFAPSPTGPLHLGHAFAAVIAAKRAGPEGRFLLRIEDIDDSRCRPHFEDKIFDDLRWLGLSWPEPVLRQSERKSAYRDALEDLAAMGLLYPCTCRRADISAALAAPQEGAIVYGPDGAVYPGLCRRRSMDTARAEDALRLDMSKALSLVGDLSFVESGPLKPGTHHLDPARMVAEIGDVVLSRRDMGTSYHLSVVIDDAAQGVTEVTRGIDLFDATFVHVLLQALLKLPSVRYYHHDVIRDETGKRLAKRDDARAIARYREDGLSPEEVLIRLGL